MTVVESALVAPELRKQKRHPGILEIARNFQDVRDPRHGKCIAGTEERHPGNPGRIIGDPLRIAGVLDEKKRHPGILEIARNFQDSGTHFGL